MVQNPVLKHRSAICRGRQLKKGGLYQYIAANGFQISSARFVARTDSWPAFPWKVPDGSLRGTTDFRVLRAGTTVVMLGIQARTAANGAVRWIRSALYQAGKNTARALWCLMGLCATSPAVAINPGLAITQLGHSAWRLQDGFFPGTPTSIAQTNDGYLWIGTQAGLVRFDGANFVTFSPPEMQESKLSRITALYGATDGSLWIGGGTRLVPQLMQWKDSRLHRYTPFGVFTSIREARDGSIWAARYHTADDLGPLCEARGESLTCYGPKQGVPFRDGGPLAIENAGAIWIATADRLARWQTGHSEIFAPSNLAKSEELEGYKSVTIGSDGSVWSGVMQGGPGLGLEHFLRGTWNPVVIGSMNSSNWEVTALLFDRDDTLWVGTADQGIYRIVGARIDHFRMGDGLSADSVKAFFEDHEGDIWVVTSEGVDKFRPMQVNTFSSRQGLSEDGVEAVLASRSGAIWVSNATTIDRIENSKVTIYGLKQGLPGRSPTALLEDRQGRVWMGLDDGVAVFDHERFEIVHPGNRPIGPVLQFAEGPDASIWAISVTVPSRLVHMNEHGALESVSPPAGTRIGTIAAAPDGALWMGLINGSQSCDLARYTHGQWETFPLHRPANSGTCSEIVATDAEMVFASSSDGVVEWRKGLIRTITPANGLPCARTYSLALDGTGALWLYLECGVAVISSQQLEAWWNKPTSKLQIQVLDISDGARSGPADFHPRAAIAVDGKLWFANGADLQFVDPKHWIPNSVPPPVHIETLVADDRAYAGRSLIDLPPHTRSVQIDFTALSFVAPQRVRFRYRLEGWDPTWQDPGGRRQTFYTNLHPGRYRFSVVAANDAGLWNSKGDSLEFELRPEVYQTWWFRLLALAVALTLLRGVFIYRLRRAKAGIQQRLAARLSERERIARDLHDTLLQSVQGLMLKFHAVSNAIPHDSAVRNKLESALTQGRDVIEEGRARVLDLRQGDSPSRELALLLTAYGANYLPLSEAEFNQSVVGQPIPLNPVANDEILNIGREAICNAFMHAEAKHIEVELTYGETVLALRIRDDGKGMDQKTIETGLAGHWGIAGMRERASALGATLDIWSRLTSGTEIELIVPAATAYAMNVGATSRTFLERARGAFGIERMD